MWQQETGYRNLSSKFLVSFSEKSNSEQLTMTNLYIFLKNIFVSATESLGRSDFCLAFCRRYKPVQWASRNKGMNRRYGQLGNWRMQVLPAHLRSVPIWLRGPPLIFRVDKDATAYSLPSQNLPSPLQTWWNVCAQHF